MDSKSESASRELPNKVGGVTTPGLSANLACTSHEEDASHDAFSTPPIRCHLIFPANDDASLMTNLLRRWSPHLQALTRGHTHRIPLSCACIFMSTEIDISWSHHQEQGLDHSSPLHTPDGQIAGRFGRTGGETHYITSPSYTFVLLQLSTYI